MSMVVDSSALVAIVLGESDGGRYVEALRNSAGPPSLSAVNAVEATLVVEARQGREASRDLSQLIEISGIAVEPFTADQVLLAVDAWRRFGKGRHPAQLNLGDCVAYALARSRGMPLLFKGDDFNQTDIPAVL
jgi:ribonuclease VapC